MLSVTASGGFTTFTSWRTNLQFSSQVYVKLFAASILSFALQTILQALSAVVMPRVAGRFIWMVSLIVVVLYEGFLSFGLGKKHSQSSVFKGTQA
jgi:predicted PurR-regulated permease PerM